MSLQTCLIGATMILTMEIVLNAVAIDDRGWTGCLTSEYADRPLAQAKQVY